MAEVLKYKVFLTHQQSLTLSKGAKLLSVQEQHGELCLWAEVAGRIIDTENSEPICIYMVGTGNEVPDDAVRYITTIQIKGGHDVLVIHVYEGPRG